MKSAREVALDVLISVDENKSYSNIQLNKSLQKVELSRADINFATEIIYGTIQHLNTIDWILDHFLQDKRKINPWVMNLLRISTYQIWYLDRVPPHAAVNEAVNIAKQRGHKGISGLVNGVLRNVIRNKDSIKVNEGLSKVDRISLEFSHPKWMVEHFIEDYGVEEAENICKVNNLAPYHSIRVNPLKTSREQMISSLKEAFGNDTEISPSSLSKEGIRVKGGGNLALSEWYREGYFSIQDESSMLVADVLDPKPGMMVLDALAAPGGKTTHIAEKMEDKGKVIALDLHKHKVKLIKEQAERLHLHIIEAIQADAREIYQKYGQVFDRILLDVPCSGLGVIRRKPDLKWTKNVNDINSLTIIQKEILEAVSPLLKKKGVLVYSTCTMTNEENNNMISEFLRKHQDFQLDSELAQYLPESVNEKVSTESGMLQILPHYFLTDGFFICRLIKR